MASLQVAAEKVLTSISILQGIIDQKEKANTRKEVELVGYVYRSCQQLQDSLLTWGLFHMRDDPKIRYRSLLECTQPYQNDSPIVSLPRDVHLEIIKFLPATSLARFEQTCRSLARQKPPTSIVDDAARQTVQSITSTAPLLSHGETWLQLLYMSERQKSIISSTAKLSSGMSHTLGIVKGQVVACGDNSHGTCGTDDPELLVSFESIPILRKIVVSRVAAGGDHSLILANDGILYSTGLNNGGQLGLGHFETCKTPQPVPDLDTVSISYIAAGMDHSMVVTTEGELYCFGYGNFGKAGYRDGLPRVRATKIDLDKRIIQCSGGDSHSLLLCRDGTVLALGRNNYGQLGSSLEQNERRVPTIVPFRNRIVQVVATDHASFCLSVHSHVFAFGKTECFDDTCYPTQLSALDRLKIVQIAASGAEQSCFLSTSTNSTYTYSGEVENKFSATVDCVSCTDEIKYALSFENVIEFGTK